MFVLQWLNWSAHHVLSVWNVYTQFLRQGSRLVKTQTELHNYASLFSSTACASAQTSCLSCTGRDRTLERAPHMLRYAGLAAAKAAAAHSHMCCHPLSLSCKVTDWGKVASSFGGSAVLETDPLLLEIQPAERDVSLQSDWHPASTLRWHIDSSPVKL